MGTLVAGLLAALSMVFLLLKVPFRKVLAFDLLINAAVMLALLFMFAGTYAGMMAAVVAGCVVSAFLYFAKLVLGCERPRLRWFGLRGIIWERVPPRMAV